MSSNLPIASTRPDLGRPEVLATFFQALADRSGFASSRFRYRLVDDRIRDLLKAGESVVRDNGERRTSCLVLADEKRA